MPRLMDGVLPPNATAYERTLASQVERMLDIETPIRELWSAEDCPEHLLPFLAWTFSVDLWRDDWPLWRKRAMVRDAIELHRLKGTEEGIRRHLAYVDATVQQIVTPPQGFFAGPNLTKEQWDGWIDQMPRLRVTLAHGTGEWEPNIGFFVDQCAVDSDFLRINDGPALYGRRAYLRTKAFGQPDSENIPLQLSRIIDSQSSRDAKVFERIVTPGVSANGTIADVAFSDDAFCGFEDVKPKFYSYALDRSYVHSDSNLELTSVPVGFEPQDTRYRRISDIGDAGHRMFSDDCASDVGFVGVNDGGELLADILYLHDPSVVEPIVSGLGFSDVSRVDMQPYRAEMIVDVPHTIAERLTTAAGDGFVGEVAAMENDQGHLEAAMDAIVSSKSLRDRILVTFQTTRERPLSYGYPLHESTPLGDRVPNHL